MPPAVRLITPIASPPSRCVASWQPPRQRTASQHISNTSQGVRSTRQRGVTNENDENAGTTRVTRAKSAALTTADVALDNPKKALVTKKSSATLATNAATRKRPALGDVSNVGKTGGAAVGTKDGKKLAPAKSALAQAAHPSGIKKASQTTKPARQPLKANTSELKRPASGSGIATQPPKRRSKPMKQEDPEDDLENVVPQPNEATEPEPAKLVETKQERKQSVAAIEPEPVPEEIIENLDDEDVDDPLMVSEYVVEIFDYLKELEVATMANPDYMDNQTELEWKMRGILVDWLLEVHTRFRLLPETLFLAVNIIDRFLSTKIVQLDRLQLVGVTAMFIASKYEEVLSPHVQNFRHVADDGFTEEEILSAERFVLSALNYDLSYPNPMNFLRRISKADQYDIQTRTLGKYLLEISCLDHRFIGHPPSQVAAAAMYLARLVLERGPWVSEFVIVLYILA
jgi:hypothetical protein